MQRYFVSPEQFVGGAITLTGEDAHHVMRVMRMKPGDVMIVSDGASRTALVKVLELSPQIIRAEVLELLPQTSEPAWSVTIAQSLPKGDKMELVIQKGTEIGAMAFMPFQSERMIVQYDSKKEAKRLERWGKIAKEASEQSHRCRIPAIHGVRSWKELLQIIPEFDLALFCYERAGADAHGRGIGKALRQWKCSALARQCGIALAAGEPGNVAVAPDGGADSPGQRLQAGGAPRILLIVGPEGGFAEREALEAEAAGAVLVGLGSRILRTETAGLVGLACLLYEAGEMEGA